MLKERIQSKSIKTLGGIPVPLPQGNCWERISSNNERAWALSSHIPKTTKICVTKPSLNKALQFRREQTKQYNWGVSSWYRQELEMIQKIRKMAGHGLRSGFLPFRIGRWPAPRGVGGGGSVSGGGRRRYGSASRENGDGGNGMEELRPSSFEPGPVRVRNPTRPDIKLSRARVIRQSQPAWLELNEPGPDLNFLDSAQLEVWYFM